MTCPNCQAKTDPNDNFCLRCGLRLQPDETLPRWDPAPAPPSDKEASERTEYVYGGSPGSNPIAGADVAPPALPPGGSGYLTPDMSSAPGFPGATAYTGPAIFPTAPVRSSQARGVFVLAGSAMFLLLAVLAVVWVYSARALPQGGRPPTAEEQRAVIAAIAANNNAQIIALKTLDAHALDGKMAGQALADNQQMVQDLRQHGLYQDAQLVNIHYGTIRIVNGNGATANTVEQWQSTIYDKASGRVAGQEPPQTLRETYYLTRQNGAWIVQQVVIRNDGGTPAPDQ